jgi:hypothetical protein
MRVRSKSGVLASSANHASCSLRLPMHRTLEGTEAS